MTLDERLGVPLMVLICAVVGFMFFWPASRYLVVHQMDVHDVVQGEPVMMDYTREIKRNFDADWRVDIYRFGTHYCTASSAGVSPYRADAVLPDPVTLAWFTYTNPDCSANLPCGEYRVEARWQVNPGAMLFKRVVRRTDEFAVLCQ